jgi:calcium binding protein 39
MACISILNRSWDSLRDHEQLKMMGICPNFAELRASVNHSGGRCSACVGASHISPYMHCIFEQLYGSIIVEGSCEECLRGKAKELVAAIVVADVPAKLLATFSALDFEGQKTFASLFDAMLDVDCTSEVPGKFSDYLESHPELLCKLLEGFESPDISLHCGTMLRSCVRYPRLTACLLEQNVLSKCIEIAQNVDRFDISCEAFALLHDFLSQKAVLAKHLETHAELFLDHYKVLLESSEYTIQRQSLKLLGRLLLERDFMDTMTAYVSDLRFLKIHMNLLRSSSPRIQHDNFHIFKIFVANPWKPENVAKTLLKNKAGLVRVLESYSSKIDGDSSFKKDLPSVTQMLRSMAEPKA